MRERSQSFSFRKSPRRKDHENAKYIYATFNGTESSSFKRMKRRRNSEPKHKWMYPQTRSPFSPVLLKRKTPSHLMQPLPAQKSKRFSFRRKTPPHSTSSPDRQPRISFRRRTVSDAAAYRTRTSVELRCVVVGDQNIGKTSLVYRYTNDEFMEEYNQTVLDMFNAVSDTIDSHVDLDIWDVGGACGDDQQDIEAMAFRNCDVYIVCFSVVNRDSFRNIERKWIPDIRKSSPFAPIILVGTKSDLKQHRRQQEFVSRREALALNQRIHGIKYIECSSKNQNRTAVMNVFESAISCMVSAKAKKHKKAHSHQCLVM